MGHQEDPELSALYWSYGVSSRPPTKESEIRIWPVISVLAYSFNMAQKVQLDLEQAQSFSLVLLCFRQASIAERPGITTR